jgi:hypothetical protein
MGPFTRRWTRSVKVATPWTSCLRLVMRGSGSGANLGARLLLPIRTPLGAWADACNALERPNSRTQTKLAAWVTVPAATTDRN